MTVGDLLELLHNAADRWTTVQTTVRVWHQVELGERARQRWMTEVQRQGRGVSMVSAGDGEQPTEHEHATRLWYARPDRWREEQDDHVSVGHGRLWWSSSPQDGFRSNEGDPHSGHFDPILGYAAHLDPAQLIPQVSFGDITTRPGRLVVRVRPRPWPWRPFVPALMQGAEEHVLSVDPSLGVVLRTESYIGGQIFNSSALVDPVWNAEVPDEMFVLEPPPGEAVLSTRDLAPRVTLEEAAGLASFAAFAISELPDGQWRMFVNYTASIRGRPDSLHVVYQRADGRRDVTLSEQRTADVDQWGRAEWQAQVELERDGTRITISSETYDDNDVRRFADTLERV